VVDIFLLHPSIFNLLIIKLCVLFLFLFFVLHAKWPESQVL
jgi:hypothetical protein